MKSAQWFTRFARWAAYMTGRPITFALAVTVILVWAITGPLFHFSDTWQLVINTGTTIVTFLMVFLIQNTQDRDTQALQVKLDELIRATNGAHNALLALEDLDEGQLNRIRTEYETLGKTALGAVQQGAVDTDVPELLTEAVEAIEAAKAEHLAVLPDAPDSAHPLVHDPIVDDDSSKEANSKQRVIRNHKAGNRKSKNN